MENYTLGNKLQCTDDTDSLADQVEEVASQREGSPSLSCVIPNECPAAMEEEESNVEVHIEINPIESMDLAEAHSRPSPSHWKIQLLFHVLACTSLRHTYNFINLWSLLLSSRANTLSAGLYLFDYVSNILVLREYYNIHKNGHFSGTSRRINNDMGLQQNNDYPGLVPFYVCLGLMTLDTVVAAVTFKLKLPPQEHPLRSAFFLPIVQFQRFIVGIFKTGSCASAFQSKESLETEALFAITAAIETGPQLVLQCTVMVLLSGNGFNVWRPSKTLVISIIASFLSASYNADRAVMYQMSRRWTFTLNVSGILGGMYTIGALLLHINAVATLLFTFNMKGLDLLISVLIVTLYFGVGICVSSYVNGLLVLLSKGGNMCSWAGQGEIIVSAYISATIGPLYPVIENHSSGSRSASHNPKYRFCVHLGLAVVINMLPGVLLLSIVVIPQSITCKLGTFRDVWFASGILTCRLFISYVATGLLLSILPCIILSYLVGAGGI